MNDQNEYLSRERLAGYDPERIQNAELVIVGCGAAGNNIVLNCVLSGIRRLRLVDIDRVSPTNLSRSPLFALRRSENQWKVTEVARAARLFAVGDEPLIRVAARPIEDLGLGALKGATVIVSAVDSMVIRAYLADAARLLQIPLVEVGFDAPLAHVAAYPNRASDEPCWRCAFPGIQRGRASCEAYAARVVEAGATPATQTVAAFVGAMATSAIMNFIHRKPGFEGRTVATNVETGATRVMGHVLEPECPGVHACFPTPLPLQVSTRTTARELLALLREEFGKAELILPRQFAAAMPCLDCGTAVRLMKRLDGLKEVPRCNVCPAEARPSAPRVLTHLSDESLEASCSLGRLGFSPHDTVRLRSERGDVAVELAGSLEQLFRSIG